MWLHREMNSININGTANYSVYCLGKIEFSEIGMKLFSSDLYIIAVIFFFNVWNVFGCVPLMCIFPSLHFLH